MPPAGPCLFSGLCSWPEAFLSDSGRFSFSASSSPLTFVHSDQTVVDRGPYRWVRHPSYTGLIIFFVGLGLALSNWVSLLILVLAPTAGLLVRIHYEEKALMAGVGEQYRRYAANHRHLFPGLW